MLRVPDRLLETDSSLYDGNRNRNDRHATISSEGQRRCGSRQSAGSFGRTMNRDERIHIGFEGFRVAILPLAGGKISSIQLAGREMLQEPLTGNFSRSRTMPFDSGDASGWDECLPSVAPCRVRTDGGTAVIPDHGDLWRVAWQILETAATRCTMLAKCFS